MFRSSFPCWVVEQYNTNEYQEIMDIIIPEGENQEPEGEARGVKGHSRSFLLKGDYLPEARV